MASQVWYRQDRRGAGALILVVLIGLVIILLLYFAGGQHSYMGQVAQTRKRGRELAVDLSTQQFSILIAQYRQEHGKLPKSPADFEDNAASFQDPWGGPVTFTCEDDKRTGKTIVHYHSDGPDKEPNTRDDINKTDTLPY
jgi:hypothetical protein